MEHLVLITGGGGFIGLHTTHLLLDHGYKVRILDNLNPQVHHGRTPVHYALDDVEVIEGDVRDYKTVVNALKDVRYIYHLAAETGVGQSMYEIERYVSVNVHGTAVLCEAIVNSGRGIDRLVLSSSRAVYGEGEYVCANCKQIFSGRRERANLAEGDWNAYCSGCGEIALSKATSESCPLRPVSVYGVTKKQQEEIEKTLPLLQVMKDIQQDFIVLLIISGGESRFDITLALCRKDKEMAEILKNVSTLRIKTEV